VQVVEVTDREEWDAEVNALGGHPMQLWGWGEVKATGPWAARRLRVTDDDGGVLGLAQVLVRKLPIPFKSLCHVPRGPVIAPVGDPRADGWGAGPGVGETETRQQVTEAIVAWCRRSVGGVGITLEPDWAAGTSLKLAGERPSPNPILYPHTLILDVSQPEDKLLAAMRKSTRYEIRKAARSGLDIRRVTNEADVKAVLELYHQSAEQAGFGLHHDGYYLAINRELGEASHLFAAYDENGKPCSFVWAIASTTTAFLLYGGVNDAGRRLQATAPVYWASISDAGRLGVLRYDLNGLLNEGISKFKRSFANHEDELIGSIDVPFSALDVVWNRGLPVAKRVLRKLNSR